VAYLPPRGVGRRETLAAPSYTEALARGSTEALLSVTPSGRVLTWSHGAEMAFGYHRDEAIGRLLVVLVASAEDVERVQAALRQAATEGSATCDGLRRRKDGSRFASPMPVRIVREGDGPGLQLTVYVGREASGDLLSDPEPGAAEAPLAPLEDPLREPLERVRAELRADAAAVYVFAPTGGLAVRATVRGPGAPAPPLPRLEGEATAPSPAEAYRSQIAVTVRVGGAPAGVLQVASREARVFTPDDARVLGLGADLIGWALEPGRGPLAGMDPAMEADLAALRSACERAMEGSHDPGVMLAAMARALVPRFADWCAADLVEPAGGLRRVAFVHREPSREATGYEAASIPGASAPLAPRDAVRAARTFARLAGEAEPERRPEERRALAALGDASWIVVPIAGRVRVLGALTLGQATPERAFVDRDVAWVRDLARRAALEVENARLHDMVQRSREQAGRATVRGKLLQEVAASLSEALTPTEVIETVVARAREGLRATGGALAVLTDDRAAFEIAGTVGAADALHNAWRRFPVHTRVPLADAGRSREVVTVESVPAGIARYPHLAGAHEKLGSLVAVPLVVDGRTVGALGLVFEEKRAFDADDLSFLRTLARQCGDAVERTRLLNAERSARAAADSEARRAAFLADASRILSASFDFESTLGQTGRMLVPVYADWCLIHLAEPDGSLRALVSVHGEGAKLAAVEELRWLHRLDPNGEAGIPRVVRTGRPEIHFEVPDSLVERMCASPEEAALMRKVGVRSQMIVPMVARGRVLGAITFRQSGIRRFGINDVPLAEELAIRAAIAVDNARLFRESQEAFLRREESLALLATLLSSAPIGIAFFDREMRVARVNDALRAAGAPADAVGLTLAEALPFLSEETRERFRQVLVTGEPVVDLEVAEASDGLFPRHWLASCYPVTARPGDTLGVGLLLADITARKRAEEALRESEERYRLLVEGVKDHAILSLDPEGRIMSWNAAAERLHGYKAEEVVGKPFSVFHPPELEGAAAVEELATALKDGRCEIEGWRVRKDGSRFYANVLLAPLRDAEGRLVGFSKLTRDLTEARRAREDLELARQQVARTEKLSTMGTLVSGVAHEIRTPLTAIANSLFMMKMRLDRGPTAEELRSSTFRQHMDLALEGIDRINRLVQDLRRFTKVPVGQGRVRAGLDDVAGEALSLFRAAYRGRIEVASELRPTPPCEVDRAQIQQLVLNLLQNASEAMPHGGTVRLLTGASGTHAFIRVVDTGVGMPPEVTKRMFEEFFTTKPEGTGLGLSIVRRIVEAHGGRIEHHTEEGKGTTFTIHVPLASAPPP